jgi:chemotaxis protein methyltransferase CheR
VISLSAETGTSHQTRTRVPISHDGFNYIRDLVHRQSANTLEAGKEYLVESRLGPVARGEGFESLQCMVEQLRLSPPGELHRRVVEAMTNNETLFFRDPRVFAMLKNTILPELAARRASDRALSIWCAACSTGQEPYSIAMLLREQLPSLSGWDVQLIASDISRDVLARARAGRYTQFEISRGLPAHMLVKYFQQFQSSWEISAQLRAAVVFQEMNLTHPWPKLACMDLIVMRNVLIYLDVDAKKRILAKATRLLAPGGYLVVGGAETPTGLDDELEPVSFDGARAFRLRRQI